MWLTKVIYARASLLRSACMRHRLLFIIYAKSWPNQPTTNNEQPREQQPKLLAWVLMANRAATAAAKTLKHLALCVCGKLARSWQSNYSTMNYPTIWYMVVIQKTGGKFYIYFINIKWSSLLEYSISRKDFDFLLQMKATFLHLIILESKEILFLLITIL